MQGPPGQRPSRPHGREGARQLEDRGRAAGVVVRAGRPLSVVSMGNDRDRLVERAAHDDGQVAQLDVAEPWDLLRPDVRLDGQPRQPHLLEEPVGRADGVGRPGHARRMVARQLARELERGLTVEGRWQRRRRQRPRGREREDEDRERDDEHERDRADEPSVDRPVDRAAPRSAPRARVSGLHAGGYSRRGQASACSDATENP